MFVMPFISLNINYTGFNTYTAYKKITPAGVFFEIDIHEIYKNRSFRGDRPQSISHLLNQPKNTAY